MQTIKTERFKFPVFVFSPQFKCNQGKQIIWRDQIGLLFKDRHCTRFLKLRCIKGDAYIRGQHLFEDGILIKGSILIYE